MGADRLLIPMACREQPNWSMCSGQEKLSHNSVYTKYELEVDGTFGGCPSGAAHCTKYAACNPDDASGRTWHCWPRTNAVGMADVKDRYAHRYPGRRASLFDASLPLHCPFVTVLCLAITLMRSLVAQWWKYNVSQLVGGKWFSTQAGGKCAPTAVANPGRETAPSTCQWRVVQSVKTANATCVSKRTAALCIV